jgi:hypothetical protein
VILIGDRRVGVRLVEAREYLLAILDRVRGGDLMDLPLEDCRRRIAALLREVLTADRAVPRFAL